jgi:hypothetical protein
MNTGIKINFPDYTGLRCLMMPYIQGRPESVSAEYHAYADILAGVFIKAGDIGFLTIDESVAKKDTAHRGARAKYGRALHTEAGKLSPEIYRWGNSRPSWGGSPEVTLDRDVKVLLANNIDNTCAIWETEHENTSEDGDIGNFAEQYPYEQATFMRAGEVHEIGILTPHESMRVGADTARQFLRIVSAGVHGRESYFTENPLLSIV